MENNSNSICFVLWHLLEKMARLVTVEPVLFGFMFCIFLIFPIEEQLIYKKICDSQYNQSVCNNIKTNKAYAHEESIVQKGTSTWMLYMSMATTFPSMFAAMVLGPCSDKIGRKFALVLPLIGGIIDAVALILNSHYFDWPVSALLVGVIISGFFGNYATILMAVFAYISDVSGEKSRTLRVALLESMVFVGGCLGELVGGVLVDKAGYFITFSVTAGVHLCNLLYVACILQESYYPGVKLTVKEALVSCENTIKSLKIFLKSRPCNGRMKLLLVTIALFFTLMVFVGSNTVRVLFVLHSPLSFSPSMVGYFLAAVMFYSAIGVIGGMPLFIHKLKLHDLTMVIIGCASTLVASVLLAFANKPWMVFAVPAFATFGGISVPCIRSFCSKIVEKDEKGAMFSAIASIEVLCSVVASALFNSVYSATVEWFPGFCFFIMAAVSVVPILLAWYLKVSDSGVAYSSFGSNQSGHDDLNSDGSISVNKTEGPVAT